VISMIRVLLEVHILICGSLYALYTSNPEIWEAQAQNTAMAFMSSAGYWIQSSLAAYDLQAGHLEPATVCPDAE
jgi:hypothetical protein